jgi:hypothetical protein
LGAWKEKLRDSVITNFPENLEARHDLRKKEMLNWIGHEVVELMKMAQDGTQLLRPL